jgi:ferredoxin-nitrite reductase
MNKIEQFRSEKDGLDVGPEITTLARSGWEAIPEGDIERLKWHGIFFRRPIPQIAPTAVLAADVSGRAR